MKRRWLGAWLALLLTFSSLPAAMAGVERKEQTQTETTEDVSANNVALPALSQTEARADSAKSLGTPSASGASSIRRDSPDGQAEESAELLSAKDEAIYLSDKEAYEGVYWYYLGDDGYALRSEANFNAETRITSYAVNQIAVADGTLYASFDNVITAANADGSETRTVLKADEPVRRFLLCGGRLYYLAGGVVRQLLDDGTMPEVTSGGNVRDFWMETPDSLCYMAEDEENVHILNLRTGQTGVRPNHASSLEETPGEDTATLLKVSGISALRSKFPDGKYWNHAGNPGASNAVNNQDGWTNTPCPVHHNVGQSSQTCNGFQPGSLQLSWQCMGYAEKCGYDVTGYNPRNNANGWNTSANSSALNSLKAGDIVRYKNDGHSIYVTAVSGNTVTYTDCNGAGGGKLCVIRWDQTITKDTLRSTFTHVRSAPGSPIEETIIRQNVSDQPASCNASVGGLPADASVVGGNSYYFNLQVSSNIQLKTGELYVKAVGESGFSRVHSYTANNYFRYTDFHYSVGVSGGVLEYYWVLTYANGTNGPDRTNTASVNVQAPYVEPSIIFSANSLSLKTGESQTISIRFTGAVYYLNFRLGNENVISASWGDVDFGAGVTSLTVRGEAVGSSDVTISLVDENDRIFYSRSFSVSVSKADNLWMSCSPSSVTLAPGKSQTVTVNFGGDGIYYLNCGLESENIAGASWGDVDFGAGRAYLTILGQAAGTVDVVVNLRDKTDNNICAQRIPVQVTPPSNQWLSFSPSSVALDRGGSQRVDIRFGGDGIYNLAYSYSPKEMLSEVLWGETDYSAGTCSLLLKAGQPGVGSMTVFLKDRLGNSYCKKSFDISVKGDPVKVSTDKTSLSLKLGETEAGKISLNYTGDHNGGIAYRFEKDNDHISCAWLSTTGGGRPLSITALSRGVTKLRMGVTDASSNTWLDSVTVTVTVDAKTFTVSYDANGGAGAPASQTKYYGETLTLHAEKPARSGYVFQGWAISKNGDAQYQPGDAYKTELSATLYAVWKQNEYTVTFQDDSGGIFSPKEKRVTYGEKYGTLPQPVRFYAGTATGFRYIGSGKTAPVFNGWFTAPSGGSLVTEDVVVTTRGNHTLYAQWTEPTPYYSVTFDGNGGSIGLLPTGYLVEEGWKITLPECPYKAPAGKRFRAWKADDKEYLPGSALTITHNVILVAQWEDIPPVLVEVAFHAGGGRGTMPSQSVEKDSALTLPENGFSAPAGKMFKAWEIAGKEYSPGDSYLCADSVTVTALWKNLPDSEIPGIVVDTVKAAPGGTAKVSISLKNNPGVTSVILRADYDDRVLKLEEIQDAGILGPSFHNPSLSKVPCVLSWGDDTAKSNHTANGAIVTLVFSVSSDAKEGAYPVRVSYDNDKDEILDKDLRPVDFVVTDGAVEVSAAKLVGDVNGDGEVTSVDRVLLARLLAEWDNVGSIDRELADVNGDGKITSADRVILARHLADWDGYGQLPYQS